MTRTRVYKVNPLKPSVRAIKDASEVIRSGGLVAFPTETVYGLGANALDPNAVRRIFIVKKRPPDNPLIIHIYEQNQVYELAEDVPEIVYNIIDKIWPGPLTLVLKKSSKVPKITTGGLNKVGIRCPAHPVALELIRMSGSPIAAPSANRSGRPSPTNAEHVLTDLNGLIDVVLDAGETFLGVESTIIDLTTDPPILLRPGPIDVESLQKILNKEVVVPNFAKGYGYAERALSPGTKYRHYAPEKTLVLVEGRDYVSRSLNLARELLDKGLRICILGPRELYSEFSSLSGMVRYVSYGSGSNLYEVARKLYQKLREIDSLNVDLCIALPIQEKGIGLAIMNRLRKASSKIYRG